MGCIINRTQKCPVNRKFKSRCCLTATLNLHQFNVSSRFDVKHILLNNFVSKAIRLPHPVLIFFIINAHRISNSHISQESNLINIIYIFRNRWPHAKTYIPNINTIQKFSPCIFGEMHFISIIIFLVQNMPYICENNNNIFLCVYATIMPLGVILLLFWDVATTTTGKNEQPSYRYVWQTKLMIQFPKQQKSFLSLCVEKLCLVPLKMRLCELDCSLGQKRRQIDWIFFVSRMCCGCETDLICNDLEKLNQKDMWLVLWKLVFYKNIWKWKLRSFETHENDTILMLRRKNERLALICCPYKYLFWLAIRKNVTVSNQ